MGIVFGRPNINSAPTLSRLREAKTRGGLGGDIGVRPNKNNKNSGDGRAFSLGGKLREAGRLRRFLESAAGAPTIKGRTSTVAGGGAKPIARTSHL